MEAIKMSFSRWMDKQIVRYPDNGFYLELNGNEWKDTEKPKCTLAKEAIWKVHALNELNACNFDKSNTISACPL